MFSRVTIIVLSFLFTTTAVAGPNRVSRGTPRNGHCEMVLVSDKVQDRVQSIALQLAKLIGALKLKLASGLADDDLKRFEGYMFTVNQLRDSLGEIRRNFSISAEQVDRLTVALETKMGAQLPAIHAALAGNSFVAPDPALGTVWPEHMPGQQSQWRGLPPSAPAMSLGPNPYWPPREKP